MHFFGSCRTQRFRKIPHNRYSRQKFFDQKWKKCYKGSPLWYIPDFERPTLTRHHGRTSWVRKLPFTHQIPTLCVLFDVPNSDSIALLLWKLWSVSARGKKNGTFWQKIRNLRIHFYALFWVVSDPEVSKNTPQSIFETKIFRKKWKKCYKGSPLWYIPDFERPTLTRHHGRTSWVRKLPFTHQIPTLCVLFDVPNSDSIALLLWKLWSVSARGKKNGTFWQKIRNLRIHFYALFWVVSDPEVSKNTPQSIFETKIFRKKWKKCYKGSPLW